MAAAPELIVIAARALAKSFGRAVALHPTDLDVSRGEVVGVLGPNGAGKSTLLKLLAGLMRPTGGSLRRFGADSRGGGSTSNARVGYVGHDPIAYRDLTPRQNLAFYRSFYAEGDPESSVAAVLARSGLLAVADRPTHTLSRGMLQRLAVARATLHEPDLLLLDEPFSGLDPAGSAHLEEALSTGRPPSRATVIVAHDLPLVARLATRVVAIARGRVTLDLAPVPEAGELAAAYHRCTDTKADVVDRA